MNANAKKTSQTSLITGASGGIGYELAKLFASDGYNLVLVARTREKLQQLSDEARKLSAKPIKIKIIARDLTELEAPEEIFAETERARIQVDILVNNAGFGLRGPFAQTNLDTELDMIQLNVVALTHLTKLYLPGMLARRSGKIMNVASTAAFQPGPFMAVYYASKAFALSVSEALWEELRGTGVTVTAVCPGATATGFAARAAMTDSHLFKLGAMDAKTVAEIAYRGAMRGKAVVITGLKNKLLAQSLRISPRALVRKIVRNLQQ